MASTVSNVTGSISSAGIGSGLNVESIVTSLMNVEKRPLTQLQTQASTLKTTLSEVGKLQSNFSALRDKAQALTSLTLWRGTTASSADAASVAVSSTAGAPAGNYAVEVSRLASYQTLTSNATSDASTALGGGTLTIELGTWAGAGGGFTTKADTSPVTVTIPQDASSLSDVRDAINNSNAGVIAALVTDASGTRLSLRSKETGAENGFRISASETADDGNEASGLSMLSYDASDADSPMARTTQAGDAQATVNGIAVSSKTNKLDNVIDGLTLSLLKTTTSTNASGATVSTPVNVTVATDTEAVKKALTDFVTAFNTLASFIKTDTAYDATTKKGGPLQGDQATLTIQSQLRAALNQTNTASSKFSTLSAIGITMGSDGTLSTNTGKLDNALGNLTELKKLLADTGSSPETTGFIRRFQNLADAALGAEGAITSRNSGLQTTMDRNTKSQEAMQKRLDDTEARLRKQYQSLDTQMAKLTSQAGYVTRMFG